MKKSILIFILCITANLLKGQTAFDILNDTIWTYRIEKYPNELPLIDSNYIFVGADKSPIVCLDKKTGKENWKLDINLSEYSKGFLHTIQDDRKGNIYFHGSSKDIFAVNKNTGKILWKHESKFDDDLFSKITISNDSIFINPHEPIFLAISTNGKVLWKRKLPSFCSGYTICGNEIYCQVIDGIYILNKKTGIIIKKKQVSFRSRSRFSNPPICIDNSVIVANSKDSVICFEKGSLKFKWTLNNIKGIWRENKSVYVYNDTIFQKIDIENGQPKWSIKDDFGWYIQPTEQKSIVYLQTRHRFLILNDNTGKLLFNSSFPYKSYTKPLIENGIIYLGFTINFVATKNPIE
jgi:outer membrane protein assembly factor BamB